MKKNVTIAIHEEKLSALEMYLPLKNPTLTAELDRFWNSFTVVPCRRM